MVRVYAQRGCELSMWINYIIFMQRGPLQCFSCILSCPWTCSTTTSALASTRTSPWSSTSPEVCERYFNIRLFLIFTLCQLYLCSIRSSSPQLIDHFLLLLKKRKRWAEWKIYKGYWIRFTHSGMHKWVSLSVLLCTALREFSHL